MPWLQSRGGRRAGQLPLRRDRWCETGWCEPVDCELASASDARYRERFWIASSFLEVAEAPSERQVVVNSLNDRTCKVLALNNGEEQGGGQMELHTEYADLDVAEYTTESNRFRQPEYERTRQCEKPLH